MRINFNKISTVILLSFLVANSLIVVSVQSKEPENSSLNNRRIILGEIQYNKPQFQRNDNPFFFPTSDIDSQDWRRENSVDSTDVELRSPQFGELIVLPHNPIGSDTNSDIRRSISAPTYSEAYRGDTVTVSGKLWSGVPGDYWKTEDVYLFYNVTQSQYIGNQVFYDGNPQYEVGSDTTNALGDFRIDLITSDLTTDYFSGVGEINLLTWFKGNPSKGRDSGSPGGKNVTFYGQIVLNVVEYVTNPNATYSFITQIEFENNTVVTTQGTEYSLKVDWSTDGLHTDQNETFGGTNQDIYTNTAPGPGVETVTCDVYYDFSVLSLNFFTEFGDTNPTTIDSLLYKQIAVPTEQQVVADAYFVEGSILTKNPIEVALDSSFAVYANLSSHTGLEPSKTIQITYSIGATNFIELRTTNGTGEIEFTKLLDKDNVTDIRQSFSIQFIALAAEFVGATLTPDSLDADMAVNITSITVTIDVNNIIYTSGLDIDYTVIVQDEFGRNAPATDFILDFPGIGSQSRTTGGGGTSSLSSTIPVYILAQQTRNKTIVVTAQNVTGVSYRYVVSGTVNDTDTFNMYYTLTLDLRDFNNDIILDGNTTSIFNNTFWQAFSGGGFYNLTVVDQWTRNPVGATIYITFNGQTSQYTVTLTRNWVIFDYADLLASGLNSSEGQVGLTFVASGGDYTPAASITQTINIYGPDNNAPVIGAIVPTPNPNDPGIHDPYFNITFTIIATDVGTGIRFVLIHYTLYEPDLTPGITDVVTCFNIGGDNYQGTINMTYAQAQYYVAYYVEIIDYAGHGVDSVGNRQTNPGLHYDSAFGFSTVSSGDSYQIGDIAPPRQEQVPTVIPSANPLNPNVTIIIFTNDSLVYSGMFTVVLVVNITNIIANVMEEVNTNFIMTNNPGTNEWSYTLVMEYNYNYSWFYRAVDDATPFRNLYQSYIDYGFMTASAIDDVGPTISNLNVDFNGSIAQPDSLLNFTVLVTDLLVDVDNVTLIITYNGETLEFDMAKQGTTDNYIYILDLADYPLDDYGNFTLDYDVETYDTVGNLQSLGLSLMIYNAAPIIPPGGIGGNLGAIVGGAVGGIIALIAVLFLWFNRHTLQTYAKKQTFRRRLRDYLREIIEDIKRDGLEGRYKEGLLKTWLVVEGIGREFFELPRYRSQTPKEFSRLLALKGKIERELIYTLLEYFEKARYGYEEITENDFNSGVRALLKIVDKIEVGEMEIES